MPFKDRKKQLAYLRAWRVVHAVEIRRRKHSYYLAHCEEIAERRLGSNALVATHESPIELEKLRSSREYARWRGVPGESRLPVRRGRRRMYLGTEAERHAQSQRISAAKKLAKARPAALMDAAA